MIYIGSKTFFIQKNYFLPDGAQNKLDTLCFCTLADKPSMLNYVSKLTEHRYIMLLSSASASHVEFSKRLSNELARFLVQRESNARQVYVDASRMNNDELQFALENLISDSQATTTIVCIACVGSKTVQEVNQLNQLMADFVTTDHKRYAIVCGNTLSPEQCEVEPLPTTELCRPSPNFLRRTLLLRMVDNLTRKTKISSNDVVNLEHIVFWSLQLWSRIALQQTIPISPLESEFISMPMSVGESLDWFVHLWNQSSFRFSVDVATRQWMFETLPWPNRSAITKKLLHLSDIELTKLTKNVQIQNNSIGKNNNNNTQPSVGSRYMSENNNNDKLLCMIMKLQEVALINQQSVTYTN